MNTLYLRAFALFVSLRVLSPTLHFMGDNPYGEPVVLDPWRFLPNAALFELGLIVATPWYRDLAPAHGRALDRDALPPEPP
jgi:hypothetical protein